MTLASEASQKQIILIRYKQPLDPSSTHQFSTSNKSQGVHIPGPLSKSPHARYFQRLDITGNVTYVYHNAKNIGKVLTHFKCIIRIEYAYSSGYPMECHLGLAYGLNVETSDYHYQTS